MSPMIAVYSFNKKFYTDSDTITEIRNDFSSLIKLAEKIIIIGLNVIAHDTHIWDEIKKVNCIIEYVNPDTNNFKQWADSNSIKNYKLINMTFEDYVNNL